MLAAFTIRILYINTLYYFGDENEYVNVSFRIIFNYLNPNFFIHPSLYFYTASFFYFCLFLIGKVIGIFTSRIDFILCFLENNHIFLVTGRIVSLIFSLGSVYLVYRIGEKLWDKNVGLLSAFIMTMLPLHIEMARWASPYSMQNFFILLAFFFIFHLVKEFNFRNLILGGWIFGLTISSDYYALILIPIYIAAFLSFKKQEKVIITIYKVLIFSISAFLVFIIFNPYILLNFDRFLHNIISQEQVAFFSGDGYSYSKLFYLRYLVSFSSLFLFIPFMLGFFMLIKNGSFQEKTLLIFPIINISLFSFFKVQFPRYIVHSLPFIALISSRMVYNLLYNFKLDNKLNNKNISLGILLLLFYVLWCFLGNPKIYHKVYNIEAMEVKQWFVDNIPQGSKILIQPDTIPFGELRLLQVIYDKSLFQLVKEGYIKRHPEENYAFLASNFTKEMIDAVKKEKIDYIVLSKRDYDKEVADWLIKDGVFIKGFEGFGKYKWYIRIYKIIRR